VIEVGTLVRWVQSADKNTPGWREENRDMVGLVFERVRDGNIRLYEDWFWVLFGEQKFRVFRKDLEEVKC
jgi:hypothetical protein